MASKRSTDVMIAGKVYTLSGYEEEGYLQRIASYINAKISEITERDEFRRIPNDMKAILIELNIADEYFKAKAQFETMEENYKKAEKELFELKHDLVDTQMKVEELLEKLDQERREKNQKTGREQSLEENYQKLQDKYQLLLQSAKTAEEKNRQFEEILRLSEQEKRELEAVNKELRLNKEKLETTLADALLGAAKQNEQETAQNEGQTAGEAAGRSTALEKPQQTAEPAVPNLSKEELTELLAPPVKEPLPVRAELSKEELTELLAPAVLDDEAEMQKQAEPEAGFGLTELEPDVPEQEESEAEPDNPEADAPQAEADVKIIELDASGPDETEEPAQHPIISEISEEDDPELQEIARQIMELEQQEKAEKSKKKNKHGTAGRAAHVLRRP